MIDHPSYRFIPLIIQKYLKKATISTANSLIFWSIKFTINELIGMYHSKRGYTLCVRMYSWANIPSEDSKVLHFKITVEYAEPEMIILSDDSMVTGLQSTPRS